MEVVGGWTLADQGKAAARPHTGTDTRALEYFGRMKVT